MQHRSPIEVREVREVYKILIINEECVLRYRGQVDELVGDIDARSIEDTSLLSGIPQSRVHQFEDEFNHRCFGHEWKGKK